MMTGRTWYELNTYALGNFTGSLGKNDMPTGTIVFGKDIV